MEHLHVALSVITIVEANCDLEVSCWAPYFGKVNEKNQLMEMIIFLNYHIEN